MYWSRDDLLRVRTVCEPSTAFTCADFPSSMDDLTVAEPSRPDPDSTTTALASSMAALHLDCAELYAATRARDERQHVYLRTTSASSINRTIVSNTDRDPPAQLVNPSRSSSMSPSDRLCARRRGRHVGSSATRLRVPRAHPCRSSRPVSKCDSYAPPRSARPSGWSLHQSASTRTRLWSRRDWNMRASRERP